MNGRRAALGRQIGQRIGQRIEQRIAQGARTERTGEALARGSMTRGATRRPP